MYPRVYPIRQLVLRYLPPPVVVQHARGLATSPGLSQAACTCASPTSQAPCIPCTLHRLTTAPNYFALLEMPSTFDVSIGALEKTYKRLQRVVHPDFYGGATAGRAEEAAQASTALNTAYRTLRSPYTRAVYLLQLRGEDPHGEGQGASRHVSPALLMEVMEAREVVEDPSTPLEELQRLRGRAVEAVGKCVQDLTLAFQEEEKGGVGGQGQGQGTAKDITVALSYYEKLVEEADTQIESRQEEKTRDKDTTSSSSSSSSNSSSKPPPTPPMQ